MTRWAELGRFLVHLRWPYQLLVLPAGYLLGGLMAPRLEPRSFILQFLNVHLLLNGGVTAYNSFHDNDQGPIGGLEHPPPMSPWMHHAAIGLQLAGLLLGAVQGPAFVELWLATMLLSVLYSRPRPRWKGHPLLSLVAVGVGTGTNTFLLGYLATGSGNPPPAVLLAAPGVALMLLSLYPVSQLYQLQADSARGDRTFAAVYGLGGVRRFYLAAYPLGLAITATALEAQRPPLGRLLGAFGLLGYAIFGLRLRALRGEAGEYRPVMRLKYAASLSFVLFTCASLAAAQVWGWPAPP